MRFSKNLTVVAMLIVTCVVVITLVAITLVQKPVTSSTPMQSVLSDSSTTDSQEVAAIKAVILKSYQVEGVGLTTLDFSQYPSVFIDDPTVKLPSFRPKITARLF